jgi:hypothetical protein
MASARAAEPWFRTFSYTVFTAICGFVCLLAAHTSAVADDGVIKRGDAIVTGFSGVKTDHDVPKTVHPLDRTFIDLQGASARVFDLSVLGTPPRGQLSDVPAKLEIKAGDVGQVFGVALDDATPPNAYLAATSMFGLQIASKNGDKIERLVDGGANAVWMPGQFGTGRGPGTIYKIDGRSGVVSVFANITSDGRENAGPALGNLAFDPRAKLLFVSDLETGRIHALSLDGKERGTFDHGTAGRKAHDLDAVNDDPTRRMSITSSGFASEAPATWGYADERRRVFGLAVNNGRLYYGVAEGPSVWSVALRDDGSFGSDPRIELQIEGSPPGLDITSITFDGRGHMYLSQRGTTIGSYDYTTFATSQQAVVVRYAWDAKDGRWTEDADEYGIGLPENYRGTQGGVALSYGYDKYGDIDYGACRQTLWTTGEHLRDGGDVVQASLGGARVVHGLQGNYVQRVKPANAPPTESWFTDFDDRFEDAQAFGHIGDVAIYAPCDPATEAAASGGAPAVYVPPVDDARLTLDKRCYAGAIGGKIRCTISVRNIGNDPLSEDVRITDLTKIMYGPGAGTVIPIASFVAPLPEIACAAAPISDFWCSIPAALLPPGETIAIDVWVDTHDLALAGNLAFRNCAMLKHPFGHAKACAEGGADIVVEKIGPATCQPGGTCKFGLKIANAGAMPYVGDVLLADAMFVGGSVTNAPVTAVNPPIACIAGDTNQLPFTCLTHLALMPGEEHTHWIDVKMPAPGDYWAENCFGALDPALFPPGPLPPGFGGGGTGNPSCVWVHVPAPKPNLSLSKTALNNGKCSKAGDTLYCDYRIEVTNHDAAAFNGPISIEEKMPGGGAISWVSAPWTCGGAAPLYTCAPPGAINIPAGGSRAFNVRIAQSVANSEADLCKVPNKARIKVPAGGAAPNLDASDDDAEATAMTLGIYWEDPDTGITFVMCDPTNLKVEKSADGPCVKSGTGFTCGYDVKITNTGPDPYKGPIKLEEKFGFAPVSVSFDGDLACSGNGVTFSCQKADVELPMGGVIALKVTARLRNDRNCELPNTATMTSPPANARGNGISTDDSASATAQISSAKCRTTIPPPTDACPDGQPIPRNGKCPCPRGATWNRASGTCEPSDEPKGCKVGWNEVELSNGRCVCRSGFRRADNGRCVVDDDDRDDCKANEAFDDETGTCEPIRCSTRELRAADGRCLCRPGYVRFSGACSPLVPVPPTLIDVRDCPRGYYGTYPFCRRIQRDCPRGYYGKYPDCRLILADPPKGCGPNATLIGKQCVCRPGYTRVGNSDCRPINPVGVGGGGRGKTCPPGTTGSWPSCRPIIRPCPPGTTGARPNCKPIVKPKRPVKPVRPITPPRRVEPKIRPNLPKLNVRPPGRPNFGVQQMPRQNFNPGLKRMPGF